MEGTEQRVVICSDLYFKKKILAVVGRTCNRRARTGRKIYLGDLA